MKEILNFFISNIEWEIVVFIVIILAIFLQAVIQSFYLLKNNRYSMGNGKGKHRADRFIDIYYSKRTNQIKYGDRSNALIKHVGDFHINQNVIDDELIKMGLIKNDSGILSPSKEWKKKIKNKFIIFFVEFYLINFIGDKREYYKKLKTL